MPSMVSPARQKVPVRWRPLRPTAEAVTQAPGGALSKRSRESIAKHTSSPHHHGHCGLRVRGHFSRTSLSHCYVCLLHVCYLHKPLSGVNNINTMLSNISFLTSCMFNQFLNHLKYGSLLKKLPQQKQCPEQQRSNFLLLQYKVRCLEYNKVVSCYF